MKQRIYLTFEREAIDSPILSSLTRDFGIVFNIFGATVNDDIRFIAIELDGPDEKVSEAVEFLRQSGVKVEIREE